MKKAAPKGGLFIEKRWAGSGIDPAVSVLDLDETPFVDVAAKSLFQCVHLTTIASLFQNNGKTQDL